MSHGGRVKALSIPTRGRAAAGALAAGSWIAGALAHAQPVAPGIVGMLIVSGLFCVGYAWRQSDTAAFLQRLGVMHTPQRSIWVWRDWRPWCGLVLVAGLAALHDWLHALPWALAAWLGYVLVVAPYGDVLHERELVQLEAARTAVAKDATPVRLRTLNRLERRLGEWETPGQLPQEPYVLPDPNKFGWER